MTEDNFDDLDRSGGPQPVDHRRAPTRAGLIVPEVRGAAGSHSLAMRQSEFEGLARAIGLDIGFSEIIRVREVKPATFIGGGARRAAQGAGQGRGYRAVAR